MGRLEDVLKAVGLRVGVLRRGTVKREDREAWIARNGPRVDVMLSHPQLVETGLDLFTTAKGGHNFSSIGFYQTGYRTFTIRQASRRAHRIGQWKPCKVRYFYYEGSMQEAAIQYVGLKLKASLNLEGKFSEEGLAAMNADGGSDAAALARMLSGKAKGVETSSVWKMVDAAEVFGRAGPTEPRKTLPAALADKSPLTATLTGAPPHPPDPGPTPLPTRAATPLRGRRRIPAPGQLWMFE
jgi:hypothetical protein